MFKHHILFIGVLILINTFCLGSLLGQESMIKPRTVPVGMATYKDVESGQYLKLTYGRPSMSSETAHPFGTKRVPYRKIWRLGDDDATELTLTQDASFAGQPLQAGTYSLFAVPDTANWKIIVNSEPGQWGLFKYNPEKDLIREEIPVYRSPRVVETFTIYLEEAPLGANMVIVWDRTSVRVPLRWKKNNNK